MTPAPGGRDPFWDEVRRLLPDVDIVVTTPRGAPDRPVDPDMAAEIAASAQERVIRAWRALWPRLLPDLETPERLRVAWFSEGPAERVVPQALGRHTGLPPNPSAALSTAARVLRDDGWMTHQADPDPPHDLRLLARRQELFASVNIWGGSGVTVLAVRHAAVIVGAYGGTLLQSGESVVAGSG